MSLHSLIIKSCKYLSLLITIPLLLYWTFFAHVHFLFKVIITYIKAMRNYHWTFFAHVQFLFNKKGLTVRQVFLITTQTELTAILPFVYIPDTLPVPVPVTPLHPWSASRWSWDKPERSQRKSSFLISAASTKTWGSLRCTSGVSRSRAEFNH